MEGSVFRDPVPGDSAITAARALSQRLFTAGLAAADPARAVSRALEGIEAGAEAAGQRILLAFGKAAPAMAEAALGAGGRGFEAALVVTHHENVRPVPGARVLGAGHPVPDAAGEAAAREVEALAASAGEGDHLLVLISGGASALLPAPAPGLTLADKIAVNALLLGSGLDITAMNLVRQNLSRLKGGGLARLAAPARVTALILSDVVGDDPRTIASGPTAPPLGGRAAARACLHRAGLWDRLPPPVRARLAAPAAPEAPLPPVRNVIVGSNAQSLRAVAEAARLASGLPVHLHRPPLTGDVEEAARRILGAFDGRPGIHLWGGETTVRVRGPGRGGRSQELALRVAMAAPRTGPYAFLAAGTDGRDGPTEAAGAIVDPGTPGRIAQAGLDAAELLARSDSNTALAASGDLLVTGPTGTNVADLCVLVIPG